MCDFGSRKNEAVAVRDSDRDLWLRISEMSVFFGLLIFTFSWLMLASAISVYLWISKKEDSVSLESTWFSELLEH